MNSKLMILTLTVLLAGTHYVLAEEAHEHQMADGTVMKDSDMAQGQATAESAKPVEVGNKICPVSKESVFQKDEDNEMGEPVKFEYNGKIYNLCCSMCIKDFKKDPEKYSKIAEDEVAQEKSTEK